MSSQARRLIDDDAPEDLLQIGRSIIRTEADALTRLAEQLDESFCKAVDYLYHCRGSVIVTGMGKAGLIGKKISATLASTGTRSHFLHPAEAIHGDLGCIHHEDVVVALSHSGETEEVTRILPSLCRWKVPIVAITGRPQSQLGRQAQATLWIGDVEEAGQWRLAPSTSTTAMLALGDALALATSQRRGFQPEDFARFHPGGSLGRRLACVEDLMRPLAQCRIAAETLTVRQILVALSRPGRRCGAVLLTNQDGVLTGIFTDSDLARILEQQRDDALDRPANHVMTRSPTVVSAGTMMTTAIDILGEFKISELPVVDAQGCPVGVIDVTDVVGMLPNPESTNDDIARDHDDVQAGGGDLPKIIPLSNQTRQVT